MGGGRTWKVTAPGLLAKIVLSDGSGVKMERNIRKIEMSGI